MHPAGAPLAEPRAPSAEGRTDGIQENPALSLPGLCRRIMRVVCDEYSKLVPDASGQLRTSTGELVPPEIVSIGSDFVDLQRARFQAEYDTAAATTQAEAQDDVRLAESAFANWQAVQADPAAATFLAELLCRGIPKR